MQLKWWRKHAVSATILLIAAYYTWDLFSANHYTWADWGKWGIQAVIPLLACYWLLLAFRKLKGAGRYSWLLLSIGCAAFALGLTIDVCYNLFLGAALPYEMATVMWMLQIICFMSALLLRMYVQKNAYRTIRLLFDTCIVLTVVSTLTWQYFLKPMLGTDEPTAPSFLPAPNGAIMDWVMLFAALVAFLALQTALPNRSQWLIMIGFSLQIIADSTWLYLQVTGSNTQWSVISPIWLAAALFIGLSGLYATELSHRVRANKSTAKKSAKLSTDYLRFVIPYLSVLVLLPFLALRINLVDTVTIGSLLCIVLLITRQIITLVENEYLLNQLKRVKNKLEQMVTIRTRELSAKNKELEMALEKMEYLAYHDVLSGLPNRKLFEKRLADALTYARQSGEKVAVMFLDLDRFKHINDNLGHAFGDQLLKMVAGRLSGCLQKKDTLSRQGGDEYSIILEGVSHLHEVADTAQKILKELSRPFTLGDQEIHITTSIGISLYPTDGDDPETLMKNADTAMYRVKEKGKNHFQFFVPTMHDAPRLELENALRKALERNEFLVYYQPRISIDTGEIVGAEALIRWNRPGYGIVSPGQFIPLAEETGLIMPIGEWVLRTACRQNELWRKSGLPPITVAVNLSSIQFQQHNLVDMITEILQETNLSPSCLELEITESMAMYDVESVIQRLQLLKNMGIKVSMDDFGTGYSSLGYLSRFPIDTLKIDRSFISAMDQNANHAAIVTAITAMGYSLKLKVLAEGVETVSQLSFLREIGCHEAQGYLYSPPLPPDEFSKKLELSRLVINS